MSWINGYPCRSDQEPDLRDPEKMRALYASHSDQWIADYLGASRNTVHVWLRRHGIYKSRRPGGNDGTHVSA